MTLENSDAKQVVPDSKIEGKVRLPNHIKSDPKLWFTIVETTFTANTITDDAKRMAHLYQKSILRHWDHLFDELPIEVSTLSETGRG